MLDEEKLENDNMLKRLNSVRVTRKQLESVIDAAAERPEQEEGGGGIYLVASMFSKRPKTGQAIYFRMLALARLVEKENIPGWTVISENTTGVVMTQSALIHAAAVCPLIMVEGNVGFDKEVLLAKALELIEPEGRG